MEDAAEVISLWQLHRTLSSVITEDSIVSERGALMSTPSNRPVRFSRLHCQNRHRLAEVQLAVNQGSSETIWSDQDHRLDSGVGSNKNYQTSTTPCLYVSV